LGDPKNFTLEEGKRCDQLYNGNGPYTDKDGYQLMDGYNLNKAKHFIRTSTEEKLGNFFNISFFKWLFGAKKTTPIMNQEVYRQFQVLNYNYRGFTDDFYKLLDMGVPISVVNGHYDGITNPMITRAWLMGYESYFENKWDDIKWIDTKYGKKKGWKNFDYELVNEGHHFVGETVKNISYEKIKELVEKD